MKRSKTFDKYTTTIKLDHHPPTRKDGLEFDRLEGGKEGLTGNRPNIMHAVNNTLEIQQ